MPYHRWLGTHVISHRSAKHWGQASRILFCGDASQREFPTTRNTAIEIQDQITNVYYIIYGLALSRVTFLL